MTRVDGTVRRQRLAYESFTDITDVPIAADGIGRDGITFAGDLTEDEYAEVWERMTSLDNEDQERRAGLRVLQEAAAADPVDIDAIRAAVLGTIDYQLERP